MPADAPPCTPVCTRAIACRDRMPNATDVIVIGTRTILYKMLNRGVFHEINGCISTGKEANVYQATDGEKGG